MDPLSFQEKLKAQSSARDSLSTLTRELGSKLLSTESTTIKTLDSELVLHQAVWFIFHQQLTSNHEYPTHQYSDLSKSSNHEMTKPFSYNTEQDYLTLLTHYQQHPAVFAKLLHIWDSTQSSSTLIFPTGLNRESLSYLMAYTILHDLFGQSQSFGNLDIANVSANQTRSSLTKVTRFLLAYIDILDNAYHSAQPKIETDAITWMLRPTTIFPKLLSIFLQSTSNAAFSNAVLPTISWFQSNEHLDISPDWMALIVGCQHAVSQRGGNKSSSTTLLLPSLFTSQSSTEPGTTPPADPAIPPPPQLIPQHSLHSHQFMNAFSTFCYLSNLTLAQPGVLSQLTANFLSKIFASLQNAIQPEVATLLGALAQVNIPKDVAEEVGDRTTAIPSITKSTLDQIIDLVQQCKQIPPQPTPHRQQLQSLFTSQQLRDAFMPILTVTELSPQLPTILQPQFTRNPTEQDYEEDDESSNLLTALQSIFTPEKNTFLPPKPTRYTANLINVTFQAIIKPLLHTPEQFAIVTTTPITAISRRNLLIMSHYIGVILQTISLSLSAPVTQSTAINTTLIEPLIEFATQSLENYVASSGLALTSGQPVNALQLTPSASSLISSSSSANALTLSTPSVPSSPIASSPTSAAPSNSNASQISFMRSVHIPAIAVAYFLSLLDQTFQPVMNFCHGVRTLCDSNQAANSPPSDNLAQPSPLQSIELEITATPLNALYTIHSMSQFAVDHHHLDDPVVAKLIKALPQPPSLAPPAQHGNRYILLRLAAPVISQLQTQFESLQTQKVAGFWAPESITPILTQFFHNTSLKYSEADKSMTLSQHQLEALKQSIFAVATCLSALPSLTLFPAKDNIIATLASLTTTFATSQNLPQALIILESLSSLTHALPTPFTQHNYALLLHVLEQYQIITANLDDLTIAKTLATLSLQLVAAINQHVPALVTRLRSRLANVGSTLFKFQVRKHIATHYTTILSFHTYLAKEIPQNFNLFNGYQRVYHRYISALLPASFEFYFKALINKNRPTSIFTPTLPLAIPGPSVPSSSSPAVTHPNNFPIPTTPQSLSSLAYFTSFLKSVPSSSAANLTSLALNELHKSMLSAFINLPLNGITAMLHPSCGGRHPTDAQRDIYVCTECNGRFLQKQRVLKSFVSKYFGDRVITIPLSQQTPKRTIELSEIAGYGGGMLSTGISGLIPQFSLDAATTTSPLANPLSSYTYVIDYVIAHTTLKMFSICPGADTRWSGDISFLRCFPTFSSFYSYMSQPQNDAIDRAVVLPIVMQHIVATLQAYYNEKQQTLPTPSASTPVATPTAASQPHVPSMEQDPLAALAHQQLHPTPSIPTSPPPSISVASVEKANELLQTKLSEMSDHIYLQLASMLPKDGQAANDASIKPLTILPNVPYVGHSTIIEAILQLERGLTVSSVQSKLFAFESMRSILTSTLANPVISTLPYTLHSSIDGAYYRELNLDNDTTPEPTTPPVPQNPWTKLFNSPEPTHSNFSHSLTLRNTPTDFQPPLQFANLYDFGYICHDKSPHHHSLTLHQLNQSDQTLTAQQQINHSRFFDKHTKLPHVTPFYPSLPAYTHLLAHPNNFPNPHSAVSDLLRKLQPYHTSPRLPFYPFVERHDTQNYFCRVKSVNSADDFIFLLCYILIIAQPRHLPSTLSYIKVIYFGLAQLVFGNSQEPEYKSFMDICIAFKAIQNVSDRLRHNTKLLFEKLVPPELLHFSRTHFTPKPYAGTNLLPTSRPLNKIETQKSLIIQSMVQEGYNPEDVANAVESIQPPQALFDDSYKSQLPGKIRSQRPTY